MTDWTAMWERLARTPVLRSMWRVGYGKDGAIAGLGWRRVFWRFWWHDRVAERRLLRQWAVTLNVQPMADESNESLRTRMMLAMSRRS
jgi:hypothetical protein